MDLVNFSDKARIAWRLARSAPVEIRMFGSAEARAQFEIFTRRHRHLPLIRNKTFGVALLRIPDATGGDPFGAPEFRNLRRRRKRALDRGYTFAPFEGPQFADAILAINRSSGERQGKPMAPAYTDEKLVRLYAERRRPFFGVFDADKILRAYCHAPTLGDAALLARFFGEHARLEDGIMYLLLAGTVAELAARRDAQGRPHWIMYDTYVGGSAGMRSFKQFCGFHPYRVNWVWSDGPS